MQTEAFNFYF